MSTIIPDGVLMSQVVYQKILGTYAGQDFQAVYMPKVYENITSYLLAKWGIERYQKLGDYIETIIRKVCQFNCDYESNLLSEEQKHTVILAIVDYTLTMSLMVRSFDNRLECAQALFPDHKDTFLEWLRNYLEADRDVVKEVREFLIKKLNEIEYNLERVAYNTGIHYYEEELKETRERTIN